jgi:CRP-like cAMP-binding protein
MIDRARLKPFALLDTLSPGGLAQAAEQARPLPLAAGDILFRLGDRDGALHFLLAGSIELLSQGDSAAIVIHAGTDDAALPLSRLKPRRYTARALTDVEVAEVDEDGLDQLLTADQTAAYEVSVIEGEDPEWMFRLFTSKAFGRIPADNLAALFGRLQPVDAQAGQVVIRQGEAGDYYYLIRRGRVKVERRFGDGEPVEVARLGVGDGFGEEALLSGDPRNATITMLEDGQLMRLSQDDFNSLLKPPLVRRVSPREALALVRQGARFLDVRTEAEQREHALPASISLPLANLRQLAATLPRNIKYITVCRSGRRCTAAGFLLGQSGFDVYVLRDGLDTINPSD